MRPGQFPTQAVCDPKNKKEFAAWCLVALPKMRGAALPMSSEYIQLVSEHLWDCGLRWHRKLQTKRWRPPGAQDAHWLTNPGYWVAMTDKDPEDGGVNMVTVLEAMRKADEKGYLDALTHLDEKGQK